MPTIAIGDIHGNLAALNDLLARIQPVCGRGDTVVFVGDYIDRGPDSKGCVDAILAFQRETPAEVVCLLGNHEDWFLRTMQDYREHAWWLAMDAWPTVRSYSPEAEAALRKAATAAGAGLFESRIELPYGAFFDALPEAHRRFFQSLQLSHQNADGFFSHAGVDGHFALSAQPREALVWGDDAFPDSYRGQEVVVYGHWRNVVLSDDGWPMPLGVGHTIGIDSIAHGVLTAIRLPDREVFQSARHPCDDEVIRQPE